MNPAELALRSLQVNEQDPENGSPVRGPAGASPNDDAALPASSGAAPALLPDPSSFILKATQGASFVDPMLALIERMAENPAIDVDRLERMLAFQEKLMARQAEIDFLEAKSRIKKKLAGIKIVKNKSVLYDLVKGQPEKGQGEAFRYAPLEEIDKHLAPLLAEEEMDLSYTTKPRSGDGGGAVIIGKLRHVKGHWEESELALPLDTSGGKNNVQAMGSTNAYGRRYIACNLFNLVVIGDDDDGTGGAIDGTQANHIRFLLQNARAADPSKRTAEQYEAAFLKQIARAPSIEEIPYRKYKECVSVLEERIPK